MKELERINNNIKDAHFFKGLNLQIFKNFINKPYMAFITVSILIIIFDTYSLPSSIKQVVDLIDHKY